MEKVQDTIYDFVFIGLGASNSLILLSLIQKNQLKNKRVAIFEADSKANNDKTYCFWAEPNEAIVADLSPIISYRFDAIKVSQSNLQNIDKQPYHYIRSIDLYNHTLQILNQAQLKIHRVAVNQITCENEIYTIHSHKETHKAHYIFDSRPPLLNKMGKKEIYLNQSFYGLHIKCEKEVFQQNAFEMMNFNVVQDDYTQFIYVIPFSSDEALVELTRFGTHKIEKIYAASVLDNFITTDFGKYEIIANEWGCIPMTTFINPPNPSNGILNTGASANLIKPSTGYGFKKMHAFAQLVTERVEANNLIQFHKIGLDAKKRFKFYDNLLLIILRYFPSKGKFIFTSLFEKQSVLTVFSFLDEKSSLLQELNIFASLPIFPFLKALYLYLKNENILRYIYAFFIVISYWLLSNSYPQLSEYFSYTVLIVGLLGIGIPHGALDYMLSKNKSNSLFLFIGKYLLIIALYYAFWQFFPLISLIVFVVYSSFHFGESEWVETGRKVDSFGAHFKAFLIGLSILMFIIFGHLPESLGIVSNLIAIPTQHYAELNLTLISWSIAILSFAYLLAQTIRAKNWAYIGLLLLLILGIKVPLILAFGIYFIFQHSTNAWQHLKLGLNMTSIQLYKKASFYTLGALFIFLLMAFYANEMLSINGLWTNFFIFIACISFPHFFLMHLFYKTKTH